MYKTEIEYKRIEISSIPETPFVICTNESGNDYLITSNQMVNRNFNEKYLATELITGITYCTYTEKEVLSYITTGSWILKTSKIILD